MSDPFSTIIFFDSGGKQSMQESIIFSLLKVVITKVISLFEICVIINFLFSNIYFIFPRCFCLEIMINPLIMIINAPI